MTRPAAVAARGSSAEGTAAAPPFLLPGEHFAAALFFLVAGAIGLVWKAPALAAGGFTEPGVAGVTHLFTLGWITTSIFGALYQFLPVALGAPVRWEGLAHLTFWGWVAGVLAFAGALIVDVPGALVPGAGLLGAAILAFAVNLGATLPRAPRRGLTWWCVLGAALFLLGGWLLGFLLAVNLGTGILGATRFTVLVVHLHIAAGGWVLLTMIGVSHHLLPMFLLSHGASRRAGVVAAALVAAGATGFLLSEHLFPVGVLRPAGLLMAGGAVAFLVQAGLHYAKRRRPSVDPGMRLAAGALGLLAVAVVLGVVSLVAGVGGPRLATAYGVALVPGGLGLFVAGHYYKILPFLTWFHRFGPVAAERDVPAVAELFDPRPARAAGVLMVSGVLATVLGIGLGQPLTTRLATVAFAAGAILEAGQMAAVVRRGPE